MLTSDTERADGVSADDETGEGTSTDARRTADETGA
jgi:hypothetical protein